LEGLSNSISPEKYYSERLEYFSKRVKDSQARLKRLALLRFGIFLVTIIMIFISTRWNFYVMGIIGLTGTITFLLTINHYLSLQESLQHDESLADINSKELQALAGDYSMFDDGDEFTDPDHPYTSDLDIFGRMGLFQYFNRSATSLGKNRLAQWFQEPLSDLGMIRNRQAAVAELAGKPEFRQEFLASGYMEKELPADKDDLLRWVEEPLEFTHWKFRFFVILVPIITFTTIITSITLFLLSSSHQVTLSPSHLVTLSPLLPFTILGIYWKKISRIYRMLSKKSELVKKYSTLLMTIEKESFGSGEMESLKEALQGKGGLPSAATKKLSHILDAFEARNNMLMGFLLNFLFLWDLIQVMRTETWQAIHKDELPKWLEVLAETDAVCCLGNFHFNHPGSIFPGINDDGALLTAVSLGHPLVPADNRVDNPATIPGWKHFAIITGANMAGKSTYLRTVGVNLVLAMAGSAVIAEEMEFQPAGLVTSIRTRDSLQKSESYFYAELKRLKYIIDRLQEGGKLIILLDEILKGTNSRDKQSGSIALLEKLLRYNASGLVATHDLALGELEKSFPEHITNKSFEVVIENDLLVFDFKLKVGIAKQLNATYLMRHMGIID
jgi:hypothetical protein